MTKRQNIGNAGEYFISALLSAKNFVVTVTLGRNIGYDLLIENPNGKTLKLCLITFVFLSQEMYKRIIF